MKVHTTNYYNTFILVSDDTKATIGTKPIVKEGKKTIVTMQYELIVKNPYKFTSDDVFFQIFAERSDVSKLEYNKAREEFFSKGQPCFRASALGKTYGFGVHSNAEGKVAIYGVETKEYENFANDETIKKVKAMKSSK